MRRSIALLVAVLALGSFAAERPSTVAALGPNDYAAKCWGNPASPCAHIYVLDQTYAASQGPQLTATLLGLRCTSRTAGGCVRWTVVSDGDRQFSFAGRPSSETLVGQCVVKLADIPNDGGQFGLVAGGDDAALDRNCDGVISALDTALPANSLTHVAVPSELSQAKAVLANLTMVDVGASGYITADSCEAMTAGPQSKSSGNFGGSTAIANLGVTGTGVFGGFCVYNSADVHLVVDVQGYFDALGGAGFIASPPQRLIDTRVAPLVRPPAGNITRVDTGAAAGTAAVMVNLTMTGGEQPGYVTAAPCSTLRNGPQSQSSGNFAIGGAIANLAVVPVDADGAFCIYNSAPVDLIVDIQGRFVPQVQGGDGFVQTASTRKLDTRVSGMPGVGSVTTVHTDVPAGTSAALVNLTMVDGLGDGYITADRCSALAAGPQSKSSGNFRGAAAIANLAVVPVDPDGTFCIYSSAPVDLVVDIQGAFSPQGALRFHPITARRLLDSRQG